MKALPLLVGAVLGALALVAARVALVHPPEHTHFHANFAVFVDGRRVDLSAPRFMEEVSACTAAGETVLPRSRAHLHNGDADVAHIHHEGVTWGHLMANLGMGLGARHLALADGTVLTEGGGRTLKFVLNGKPQFAVHNELIRSGDRLLVSFGAEAPADALARQFPQVAANAESFNSRPDPAGCSGPETHTVWDRIRHAVAG